MINSMEMRIRMEINLEVYEQNTVRFEKRSVHKIKQQTSFVTHKTCLEALESHSITMHDF